MSQRGNGREERASYPLPYVNPMQMRAPEGGNKVPDTASKVPREARGSVGGSHPSVTDETREVAAERSESITSNEEPLSVRDLSFDLEQPWQRSLLRELENIENSEEDKHARPRSQKILLGRAQSGDYLVEYSDDDASIMTDTSSTLPMRSQSIHRKGQVGHAALFQDEDDDDFCAPSADSSLDRIAILDSSVHRARVTFGETRDVIRDSHTDRSDKARQDDDGQKRMPPEVSRGRFPSENSVRKVGLARANALVEDRAGYLNSRPIRMKSDEETTATDAADYDESAACMCIGYNMLDFFEKFAMPSPPSSTRHKKRRTSLHGPASRPSSLGTVSEEKATHQAAYMFRHQTSLTRSVLHVA